MFETRLSDQLQTIHVRHHDVRDDQVMQLGFIKCDAGLAVISSVHRVTGRPQQLGGDDLEILVVVN